MRFEIPFDPVVFKAKNELKFKLVAGKIHKRVGFFLLLAALLLLWSLVTYLRDREVDQVVLSAGIVFVYFAILAFVSYRKGRRLSGYITADASSRRMNAQDVKIYEFEEEYFRVADMLYDQRYKWPAFKYFQITERSLLLHLREAGDNDFLMISEAELGYEASKEVVKFVATKLRKVG